MLAPYRERIRAILTALGPARAHALARRVAEKPNDLMRAMPALAVHFDEALLAELLERDVNGGLAAPALAAVGAQALPRLAQAWSSAVEPKVKSSRGAAIVRVIADGSGPLALEDRQAVQRLGVDLLDLRDGESYWPADQTTAAGAVLRRLEDEPRARLLLEALRAAKRPERAYRFVGSLAAPGRLDATKVMLERASTLTNDDHFDAGVSSPGEDAPEVFARALPEGGSAMLLRRLEKALGHHGFPRFLASRGETKKTWLEALRAIAAEALGARERIYLLEPEWRTAGSVAQGPSGSRCRGGPTAIVSATCSRSISRRRPSSARASRSPRRARARSRSTCRIHVAARTTSWACADQSPSRLRPF